MPLPLAAIGVAAQLGKKLVAKAKGKKGPAKGVGVRRRRRRARLTTREMMELTTLKNILGKTAAANALPYYLGRGG